MEDTFGLVSNLNHSDPESEAETDCNSNIVIKQSKANKGATGTQTPTSIPPLRRPSLATDTTNQEIRATQNQHQNIANTKEPDQAQIQTQTQNSSHSHSSQPAASAAKAANAEEKSSNHPVSDTPTGPESSLPASNGQGGDKISTKPCQRSQNKETTRSSSPRSSTEGPANARTFGRPVGEELVTMALSSSTALSDSDDSVLKTQKKYPRKPAQTFKSTFHQNTKTTKNKIINMQSTEDQSLLDTAYKNSNLSTNSDNSSSNFHDERVQSWNQACRPRHTGLNSSFDEEDRSSSASPEAGGVGGAASDRLQQIPVERLKTLCFLGYCLFGAFLATLTMQVTNQRVEHDHNKQMPLRDVIWDLQNLTMKRPSLPELFRFTELWGITQMAMFFAMIACHKHRLVILRRFLFVLGTLYIYRSFTTVVTSLPVPGLHVVCQPKFDLSGGGSAPFMVLKQTFVTLSGGGMQIANDPKLACGGYLFSGHTVVILGSLLFNFRYMPKIIHPIVYKFWRYTCFGLSLIGIFCVILAHEHYTVDVVVAYYFITTLFWNVHAILDSKSCKRDMMKEYISAVEFEDRLHRTNEGSDRFPTSRRRDAEFTSNPMRKYWFVGIMMWSEKSCSYKHETLPFEYENPIRAFVTMLVEVKNDVLKLANRSHRNARKGYDMVRERTEIV